MAAAAATLIDPITADFVAAMSLSDADSEHPAQVGIIVLVCILGR